jgi:hypothetical protein
MPIDRSPKLYHPRLDQKRERRIRKWKIDIRPIAKRHSKRGFQNAAEIVENRDPGILPNDNSRSRKKQNDIGDPFEENVTDRARDF